MECTGRSIIKAHLMELKATKATFVGTPLSMKSLPSDHIVEHTEESRDMCRAHWSKMMQVFPPKSTEMEKLYNNSDLTCGQTHFYMHPY